jgi:hypothetical protein
MSTETLVKMPEDWKIVKSKTKSYGFSQFDIIIPCSTKKMAESFALSILKNEKKSHLWDEYCNSGQKGWVRHQIYEMFKLKEKIESSQEKLERHKP